MDRKVEILAPAGSLESLIAAVENGADAVYLGGTLFNARQYASNFNNQELKKAVDYCHRSNVKVYVTVNILIHEKELQEAIAYLYLLHRMDVDAVIVQDVGVLHFLRKVLPEMPIHASTQMTIHNEYGACFLQQQGVKRIVLARELSLNEIAASHHSCNVELEVFVHGALCISYSGQCLLSSMIGGRSGNRGRCAQPCRLSYSLVVLSEDRVIKDLPAPGDHLLSTRDLKAIEFIPQLIGAGSTSFKFEGRMKRPEYVATVIRIYKQALDRYYQDPKNYKVLPHELQQLEQVFNRDFTTAYLTQEPGEGLISYTKPSNRGVFLGRVLEVKDSWAKVRLEQELQLGDGIEVWVSVGGRKGETVKNIRYNGKLVPKAKKGWIVEIIVTKGVQKQDRIFKTYDKMLMDTASMSYTKDISSPDIMLFISAKASVGQPLEITAYLNEGDKVTLQSAMSCQAALKHPLDNSLLKKQLGRLGDTRYKLGGLESHLEDEVMLPISELNRLRRSMVARLDDTNSGKETLPEIEFEKRRQLFIKSLVSASSKMRARICQPKVSIKVGGFDVFSELIKLGKFNRIYIPIFPFKSKTFTLAQTKEAIELGKRNGIEVFPYLPGILHSDAIDILHKRMKALEEVGIGGVLVGNLGFIQFFKDHFPHISLYGDYSLNVFNSIAASFFLQELGLKEICLSPELSFKQISDLPSRVLDKSECLVHGNIPLMQTKHCPIQAIDRGLCQKTGGKSETCQNIQFALKDRKNYIFPLELGSNCIMHLFNSKVLCLVDNLSNEVQNLGLGAIRLELQREDKNKAREVVELYLEAINRPGILRVEQVKKLYPQGITKGHYFRGVE